MTNPFRLLGLDRSASADDVRRARRELAKLHHPDAGGDADMMRQVNQAAGQALHEIANASASDAAASAAAAAGASTTPSGDRPTTTGNEAPPRRSGLTSDMPSFTVEALPVETFEALLVVGAWIGEVLDDEPPYLLEMHLYQPAECWCRLELVPDAGASTVSLTLAGYADVPMPSVEAVRDVWVEQLNGYDWP